ncbi:MAG: hypothetical protein Q4D32_08210 [Eubacteriales bacterium]|nr:hypothetical protein [Eubacteriales bacterium]
MAEGATTGQNEKNEKESISNISQSAKLKIMIEINSSVFAFLDFYDPIITFNCG